MYIIYDKDDNPPTVEGGIEGVAKFVGLQLSSLRSYISKKRPIKDGSKIYEIVKVKTTHTSIKEYKRRIL